MGWRIRKDLWRSDVVLVEIDVLLKAFLVHDRNHHDATMPWCHSPQTDWLLWIEQLLGARVFIVFLGSPKEVRCIHFCHWYSAVEWDERGVFAAADLLGTINTILSSGEGEMLTIFMFKRLAHIVASTYYLLWDEVACKVFVKKWSVLDLPIKSPWNSWLVVWNMFYVST